MHDLRHQLLDLYNMIFSPDSGSGLQNDDDNFI